MDGGEMRYLDKVAVREENGRAVYASASELKQIRSYFGLEMCIRDSGNQRRARRGMMERGAPQ